jgi:hypothetical protein
MSDTMFDDPAFQPGDESKKQLNHESGDKSAEQSESSDKPSRRSQSAHLVDSATARYALGVSEQEEPFGTLKERPHIALMLRGGKSLRADLARRYFDEHDQVPSQQALSDALMVCEGRAAQQPSTRLHLRVAEQNGCVYIDMGDTAGRIIELSGGRWAVTDSAPVVFRRTKLTAAMPHPHGGDLSKLWQYVPVDEGDRTLLLAWMVSALITPDAPHPVLFFDAEQGALKSSSTRRIVDLVDPSPVPLRKEPRDPDQWVTAASASWVVALDNVSGEMSGWLSDALCRASTGDGDVRRALYTDSDVSVVAFRRCAIVNGVDVVVTRGDLAERLLRMQLKRPQQRRGEAELAEAWQRDRPQVFGALLTLAAQVLQRLPAVEVADPPRMADYAKVFAGVDEIFDTDGLARYGEKSRQMAAETLYCSFVAALIDQRLDVTEASSGALLKRLTPVDSGWKRPRDWPKNARAVTALLTRNAPALRAEGWSVDNDGGHNKGNTKRWTIKPPEKEPDSDSPHSPDSQPQVIELSGGESGEPEPELASNEPAEASYGHIDNSCDSDAVTCANESASQASLMSGPSLDDACVECGEELIPDNNSGLCAECRFVREQRVHALLNDVSVGSGADLPPGQHL